MSKATQANIKQLLKLTGATHQQLANIAGVDRSAVSHWKSGKTEPRMGHLQRIANHYGITTANLANPNGMKYMYKGVDGRLHEDVDAKAADMKKMLLSVDPDSALDSMLGAYSSFIQISQSGTRLDSSERELIDMFRSLNDTGKQIIVSTVVAFVKSGDYSTH